MFDDSRGNADCQALLHFIPRCILDKHIDRKQSELKFETKILDIIWIISRRKNTLSTGYREAKWVKVGLGDFSGVVEALRVYLGVLKYKLGVLKVHNWFGGSQFSLRVYMFMLGCMYFLEEIMMTQQ